MAMDLFYVLQIEFTDFHCCAYFEGNLYTAPVFLVPFAMKVWNQSNGVCRKDSGS